MISSQRVEAIIFIYLGYATIIGFKRGLFNVLVGIFGIYGASLFTWLFQSKSHELAIMFIGVSKDLSPVIVFIVIWILAYFIIIVLAKILTSIFNLTGVNLFLRIIGALLNASKAVLIIVVMLTFITNLNSRFIKPTKTTKFFTNFGSRLMKIYKNTINENKVDLKKAPDVLNESFIINDDFRYNLLER